jgi:hypothetical protein
VKACSALVTNLPPPGNQAEDHGSATGAILSSMIVLYAMLALGGVVTVAGATAFVAERLRLRGARLFVDREEPLEL